MNIQQQHHFPVENFHKLKTWFSGYVRSLYSTDPTVQQALVLKEAHSLRVCSEILYIGKNLNMDDDNALRLAEVMALFHDIGRFEQYTRYRTFVDGKSENHAELGVKLIRQEKLLAGLEEETQTLIIKAISYHNRISIPENESPICDFFSRLLRDADKLDIFHLVSSYYYVDKAERSAAMDLDLPDTPDVSDDLLMLLQDGKMISMQQMKSLNDFKLLQMAWIYDINFQPTFQRIRKMDYLKKIRDTLPPSAIIDQVYADLLSYLEGKSNPRQQKP